MLLNEAILLENFKDAERIIANAFSMSKFFAGDPKGAETYAMVQVRRFRQERDKIPSDKRDISMWIGKANRVNDRQSADAFFYEFSEVVREAEEKTPAFYVMGQQGPIRVTYLENYAAVKKLCGRMRICIRANPQDFESYNRDGALFLIEVRDRKYVFEYSSITNDGSIWDENNEEMDIMDFFDSLNTLYIPSFPSYDMDIADEAMDFFSDMWRMYRRGAV